MTFEQKQQWEIIKQNSEYSWSVIELDFSKRFYTLQKAIDKELNAASDAAYAAMLD